MLTLYFHPVVSSIFLLSFFLAYSQPSQIGCLPYFHTWCSLSVNFGSRSEMCCTRLAENTGCKKSQKIRHLGTIAQLLWAVPLQLRHVLTLRKKAIKLQYLLHMPPQYGKLGPLADEIGSGVWGTPANLNEFRVLPSLLQWRRSPEANHTLHDVWPSPGLVHYIYIFRGSCYLTEFCPVQNSLYVQVLRSPIFSALLHGTPEAGVSQTLRRGTGIDWVGFNVPLNTL